MKKKIIILYDFLKELGGLERVMFFQANKLKDKHDVELCFSHISKEKSREIVRELNLDRKVKISSPSGADNEVFQLLSSFLFPSRTRNKKSDLTISHSFMCSRMAWKNKKLFGTPYVIIINHPPNFLYSANLKWANNLPRFCAYSLGLFAGPLIRKIDKKVVQKADVVTANSKYTAERVRKIYGVEPVVLYPVLTNEFKIISKVKAREHLEKLGVKNKFILLHGRMIKDKRPDLAVRAFHLLSKKSDVELVISGTIEEKKKILELIQSFKIDEKVKILGKVSKEELVALYNSAECFLMSAPKEDFGLTPIEAMACGCPVVAWDDGAGPSETVNNGETGLLAKPYSVNDYAEKILSVLDKDWNKKSITKSVEKYSEKEIKKELDKIVEKLI